MALPEYSRRMNRGLDHIDRHLDQPLALDELARIAHFSAFHFHRVYAAWRPARQSNLDQAQRKPGQAPGADAGDHGNFPTTPMECHMNIQFRDFPATRVAYLRKIGPYGAPVSAFLSEVFRPWLQANGLDGQPWFGVAHDDPSITPAQKCRYDACVAVPENFVPGGQAMLTTLPGGRYAVGAFVGTALTIGDAWTEMFRNWLPASGMQCDARPVFEHYTRETQYDPATGVFNCELCIPVKPL